MTDANGDHLAKLMAWLSPAYPVGAFSYSHGLEWAVEAGDITDAATLEAWLRTLIWHGSAWSDAVLFCHIWRTVADDSTEALAELAELSVALQPTAERALEATAQGRAFVEMTRSTWPCVALDHLKDGTVTYPVAVATASAGHAIPLAAALTAYLNALVANWISAGVRLIPLGQTDGQRITTALVPEIAAMAEKAKDATLSEIGTATFRADIASMKHETQYTRLFRS